MVKTAHPSQEDAIGSHTPVNHAVTERQNVVAKGLPVGIAKISRFSVTMPTVRETVSRSGSIPRLASTSSTDLNRQFGSMTEKVADYEKLLRELMNRASLDDTVLIKSVLERVSDAAKLEPRRLTPIRPPNMTWTKT